MEKKKENEDHPRYPVLVGNVGRSAESYATPIWERWYAQRLLNKKFLDLLQKNRK